MLRGKTQHFIRNSGHKRQENDAGCKAHEEVCIPANGRKEQDRNRHHKEQIIRAAAWMQAAVLHGIFRRKRLFRLVAGDGLMLRSVVHEYAPHILHP